jgi:hypothetical protein
VSFSESCIDWSERHKLSKNSKGVVEDGVVEDGVVEIEDEMKLISGKLRKLRFFELAESQHGNTATV